MSDLPCSFLKGDMQRNRGPTLKEEGELENLLGGGEGERRRRRVRNRRGGEKLHLGGTREKNATN